MDISKTIDGRIGKCEFDIGESKLIIPEDANKTTIETGGLKGDEIIGNALNIFINYESVLKNWYSTYTRIDFLEKILQQ